MLSGKDKRYLRSLANNLKATIIIGKDGLNDNVIDSLDKSLKAHELVKISILKSCPVDIKELTLDLLASCKGELVQTLGKTLLIYRPSKERKIILP